MYVYINDIGMKLFSRKISELAGHSFNQTVMGPLLTIGQVVE